MVPIGQKKCSPGNKLIRRNASCYCELEAVICVGLVTIAHKTARCSGDIEQLERRAQRCPLPKAEQGALHSWRAAGSKVTSGHGRPQQNSYQIYSAPFTILRHCPPLRQCVRRCVIMASFRVKLQLLELLLAYRGVNQGRVASRIPSYRDVILG